MSLEFFKYTEDIRKEWDDFVINHKYGSIHQISQWKDFQELIPGREQVLGFGVKNKKTGKILAITFAVRMETGVCGKFWFYSARGPVFDPHKNLEVGKFLIKKVAQELRELGGLFWRFDPYFNEEEYKLIFLRRRGTYIATQSYQPTDTLEIDLRKTEESILSGMKRKGRYNINLARKKGIRIINIEGNKVTDKDINDFWKLNAETTSRDRFSSHGKKYYLNFCHNLFPYTVLFFAETENGKRIATAISTFCGKKAIYYFGASTSDSVYRNLMAPYLLQWEMMQYADFRGCESYDFLGIAPEGESCHPYTGISEFKWKFGGERKVYDTGKEIVFRSFWYWFYRFVKKIKNYQL